MLFLSQLLVGVIDSQGTVFVFEVKEEADNGGFTNKLLLTITNPDSKADEISRFIWYVLRQYLSKS